MSSKNIHVSGNTEVVLHDKIATPRKAKVLLLNDDYTTMEFVVQILVEIFRKNLQEATVIMLSVHEKGQGTCGVYSVQIAETKVRQVHARARTEGFPLRCAIELI